MIIKKPYAFLIKNFRLIHGILFGLLLYLLIRTVGIYSFFSGYASNSYYIMQANLASRYIEVFMYISCILIVFISSVIYYLLELKNKGNKMYMFVALYNFILFFLLFYLKSVFTGLETEALSVESVRVFRDISLIVLLPQLIFIFVMFGRTLGFNIKQFDFKKDLEELQIDTSDSEEIEVTLTDNTYKIKRFFRKVLRLTKYFFLENKIFVIGVSSILVFILAFSIYRKIGVYSDAYDENQNIQAQSLWFNVNESYYTKNDMKNSEILEGKIYILVNTTISNKSNIEFELDNNIFKLSVNNKLLAPTVGLNDKFIDLGTSYSDTTIKAGEDKNYIVVFEVDDELIKNEYVFKVKDFVASNNGGITYKDIIIKPNNIDSNKDEGVFNLPGEIKLSNSLLKESTLLISNFEIGDRFKEEYTYQTQDGKYHKATYTILPSMINKTDCKIIRFKSKITVDDTVSIKKLIKNSDDLLYYYGIIRYRYMGNYIEVKLDKMKLDFESKDYIYMEVPKGVELANKIDLILIIRGVKYTISLK